MTVLSADIGGTNFRLGAVEEDGSIVKLLLYSADFTENSYNYTVSVWHCPVKPVEQKEKAKKESSLASRLLSSWLRKDSTGIPAKPSGFVGRGGTTEWMSFRL